MICDTIENAGGYYCLGTRFQTALEYLQSHRLNDLEPGIYEIDGRDIFLKIQEYTTDVPDNCKIELHELYADIQLLLEGYEEIGYAPRGQTVPRVPYNENTDMSLVSCSEMSRIIQKPGRFIIAFPQDAHQSCRILGEPCRIKKALMKVKL